MVEEPAKGVVIGISNQKYDPRGQYKVTRQQGEFQFNRLRPDVWDFTVTNTKAPPKEIDPHPQRIPACVNCPDNSITIILILPAEARASVLSGKTRVALAFYQGEAIANETKLAVELQKQEPQQPAGPPQQVPLEKPKCLTVIEGKVGKNLRAEVTLNDIRVSAFGIDDKTQETFSLAEQKTDKEGSYVLNLPQNREYDAYILTFDQKGYKSEIRVQSCDTPPPPNVLLKTLEEAEAEAAKASEQSEVVEALVTPPFEATRRYVFYQRVMQALPLREYRSFDEFALLAPGVLPPPQTFGSVGPGVSPGVGTAGQFSINGLRSRENNFSIDGSDNNDEDIGVRRQGFVSLTPQPVETLQEFQIITALADATYGRNIGGQLNALTQSGNTEFHGSLYSFYTDNGMNARDFFDGTTRGNPPTFELRRNFDNAPVFLNDRALVLPNPVGGKNLLRRTQAGFLLGGRIRPTDTFYFGSLERKVNRENREMHFAVPTVRQRGVFESGETGFRAGGIPMYPASIPGDAIFSLYPFANNPLGPYGHNTYTAVLPADADATLFTIKLNQRVEEIDEGKKRPRWAYIVPFPMLGDLVTGRFNLSQDKNLIPVTGGALFSQLRPRVRTQNPSFYLNRRLSENVSDTISLSFGRTRLLLEDTLSPSILPSAFFPEVPFLLNAPLLVNVTAPAANGALNPTRYVSASSPQGAALLSSLGYTSVTQTEQITGPLGQVIIPGFSPVGVDVYHFPQSRANNTFHI
ncbi:MAG: Plug domain-containing protein, partial [Pyrinomonadaceae bacterium]